MGICDRCYDPGACCRNITLSLDGVRTTYWSDNGVDGITKQIRANGLPFDPLYKTAGPWKDEDGRPYEVWALTCPKLNVDGRCSIYKSRPDLCKAYEAASDGLCVHYGGAEGVDLTIDK